MKILLMVIVALGSVAGVIVGNSLAFTAPQDVPRESKVQPKEFTPREGQPVG